MSNISKCLVMIILICGSFSTCVHAEWINTDNYMWWYKENESYAIGWRFIDDNWYFFDNNGYMKTGWLQYKDKWYYLSETGEMLKDTSVDGYYLDVDGVWIDMKKDNSNNTSLNYNKNEEEIAQKYVVSLGYEINYKYGEIDNYTFTKNNMYGSLDSYYYSTIWGVQNVKPENYFDKQIITYGFNVKNHPLQKIYNSDTNIYIMICENKVIGGYSFPNGDFAGSVYSVNGSTLEEVAGMSYDEWEDRWKELYKNF